MLLEVHNLTKRFTVSSMGLVGTGVRTVHAVNDVSFGLAEGETLGLAGESGCGKTTTGLCVVQLIKPDKGQVLLDGVDLTQLKGEALRQERRKFQIVFQDPLSSLNPRWSVRTVIAEPMMNYLNLDRVETNEKVSDLLHSVGLPSGYAGKMPHQLSGGERQRVSIARSLALQPKMVMCDEAVSALDVSIQAQILNLFKELQQRFGLSYLFISHNLSVLKHLSHRLGIMYLGRIVEMAETAELFAHPLHPYTHSLLASIPRPDPRSERARTSPPVKGELSDIGGGLPPGCLFHPRCPYAQSLCLEETPPLDEIAQAHSVACHFPLDTSAGMT
jgi:oligopeptide/dipeptide ABC transporter ATP-binding protein